MDLQLKGKRALVTGSTAGIGFAIAAALAHEGAKVIVNGRTQERVNTAIGQLRQQSSSLDVAGLAADLGNAKGCETVTSQFPEIDILVNNLGIFESKPFEEIPDSDWTRFFEVNVLSGVRLSRAYLPGMKRNGWGRIIFISSESGLQIPAEMVHYGMTKTAQLSVARGIAESVAGSNITVNAVLPGPTESEGVSQFVGSIASERGISREAFEKTFFEHMRPSSLLKRFEKPEEIGSVVAFVASPLASAINGAAVRADGGVVRSIG